MKLIGRFFNCLFLIGLVLAPLSCSRTVIVDPVSTEGNTKVFGKPVFSDDLYYFSKQALQNIKSYDGKLLILTSLSGVVSANETVNTGGRIAASEIKVGDYLVSEPADAAPQGLFGRVKNIVKNGTAYVVELTEATFEEVFKDVNVKSEYTIPINFDIPEKTRIGLKANGTGAEIVAEISGSVSYYITMGYEIRAENYEIEKASLGLSTKSDQKINLKVGFGGTLEATSVGILDLFPFSKRTIFFIGPVPVVITIAGSLYAKVSMDGKVTLEVEIIKKSSSVLGGTYEKGKDWQEISNPDKDVCSINPIAVDMEGGAKLGLYAGVTVKLYEGVAGIFGDIGGYAKLKGNCVQLKGNTIPYYGLEITGGMAVAMFSKRPGTLSLNFQVSISEDSLPPIVSNYSCSGIPLTSTTPPVYNIGGKSFGDPNIVTFDGKSYSFNGVGEFVAVKSTVDNFEIQVRQEELKNRSSSGSISWNTGLAINTGSDKLCFYPGKYFINGTQYAYSSSVNNTLQNDGSVTGNTSELTVNVNGDIVKVFNRKDAIDYSVVPSARRQTKMIGIFGDFNEDDKNDVRIRNGNTIDGSYNTLYPTFTDSWRINQAQSLFVYDSGKNSASYTDKNFPRVPLVITTSQRASAEQACKNAGVRAPFLEGCINDVVATGDVSFAQHAKELQDESTIRSFDIKFGPNDDKSLLTSQINSGSYGTDYLLCGTGTVSPEIQRPVSIINGFETNIYMASETPDPQKSILASSLSLHVLSGLTWTVSGGSNYNYYDPILNLQRSIDPKVFIFDGKIHKVTIQSNIDLATKLSSYKLLVDDAIILEKKDFTIRAYNLQNKLPFSSGISLKFGAASGAANVKLYRWSFKTY